jgi:hypothetical protein
VDLILGLHFIKLYARSVVSRLKNHTRNVLEQLFR